MKLTTSKFSLVLSSENMFQHRTFVHIFDQSTQNSRTVVNILKDVFSRLKEQGRYQCT